MISRNRKLLLAAVGAAALMATPLLARTLHTQVAPAQQARGADGKAIGAQPSQSKASQLRRGVVCGMDGNASNCLMLPMSLINSNNASAPPTEI